MEREKRYKTLLESVARWKTIVSLLGMLILFVVTIIIGAFGPSTLEYQTVNTQLPAEVMRGNEFFSVQIHNMSGMNQEIYNYLKFSSNVAYITSFSKSDVSIEVKVEARPDDSSEYVLVSNSNITKTLDCPAVLDLSVTDTNCSFMVALHLSFITNEDYRVSYKFNNLDTLYATGFLSDQLTVTWLVVNVYFTAFEIGWRYTFFALSLGCCIMYYVLLSRKTRYGCWTIEQKWLGYLCIMLILYNNPLFAADFLAGTWFFPFLNICFLITFFASMMLCVLVFTHYVIKKPHEITVVKFYLPKFFVVGVLWVFAIVFFSWLSFNEKSDPTYSTAFQIPGFIFIAIVFIAFLVIYLLMLIFYVIRTVSNLHLVPVNYSARFKMIWFLFVIMILATFSNLIVLIVYSGFDNAASFLSYFSLYNLFIYYLCVMFLPSSEVANPADEGLSDQREDMNQY